MKKLSAELLSLVGEYAVASELCRRGVYSQLTLGNHKRTDILVEKDNVLVSVQVKTKQTKEWPGVSGHPHSILVLVDIAGKAQDQRPDFYILNFDDWKAVVTEAQVRLPRIHVDEHYHVTYPPPDRWTGLNLKVENIAAFKDQWEKIVPRDDVPSTFL
jgi:hypothetical protein